MKKKMVLVVSFFLLMVATAVPSFGQRGRPWKGDGGIMGGEGARMMGGGMRGGFRAPFMGRIFRQLDLDEGQKEAVKALLVENREAMRELRQQIRTVSQELNAATLETDVSALAAEQGRLLGLAAEARALLRLEIVNRILTEEQRAQLNQLREERRMRRPGN